MRSCVVSFSQQLRSSVPNFFVNKHFLMFSSVVSPLISELIAVARIAAIPLFESRHIYDILVISTRVSGPSREIGRLSLIVVRPLSKIVIVSSVCRRLSPFIVSSREANVRSRFSRILRIVIKLGFGSRQLSRLLRSCLRGLSSPRGRDWVRSFWNFFLPGLRRAFL